MTRESAFNKGRRYLVEGRVVIQTVLRSHVVAAVRGDGAVNTVSHDTYRGWRCTCPAVGPCSHRIAVGLVVALQQPAHEPSLYAQPRRTA